MAKKTAKRTGRSRSGAGSRRAGSARRKTGRRTAGAKTPRGKRARKVSAAGKKRTGGSRKRATKSRKSPATSRKATARSRASAGRTRVSRRGGTGRERRLGQTPETGRTVKGRTNPMPTRRSTGTAAGAGSTRRAPGLERARRELRDVEENVPTPPSSLDMDRHASAVRTGRQEMREARQEHNETSQALTGGDVDADWEDAYAVGDEAPGGDNPTPDQDRVDDIGRSLGVQYQDNEELRSGDKISDRDRHRWELDPASSEDYRDRE